jgi:hypothetical protein
LWIARKKLAIEWIIPKHPANLPFHMTILLQQWQPVVKRKNKGGLALATGRLKDLHARFTSRHAAVGGNAFRISVCVHKSHVLSDPHVFFFEHKRFY